MKRIAVLLGGPSHEHEVSTWSGAAVLQALGADGFEVRIERDGRWVVDGVEAGSIGAALDCLTERAEVAFIALHGPFGEDGTIQAVLETVGLPYTGSAPGSSALAMDKARAKHVYRQVGLPTPPSVHLTRYEAAEDWRLELAGPWVVKPSRDGSSFGVSFADTEAQVREAAQDHLWAGREVLIESRILGREFTCAVLEDEAGVPRPLPVTELIPTEKFRFFDFEAKYTPGATREVTPAEIEEDLRDRIQALAVAAHRALGCRDVSRTDFMLAPEGPLLLETNTVPGMTATSLLPQAAEAAGVSFQALVRKLVDKARARAP